MPVRADVLAWCAGGGTTLALVTTYVLFVFVESEYAGRDNRAILSFLKQRYLDGVQLRTFKLLLVGEGGGGKTQLANRLRGEPFVEGAPMTNGVATSEVRLEGAAHADLPAGAKLVAHTVQVLPLAACKSLSLGVPRRTASQPRKMRSALRRM